MGKRIRKKSGLFLSAKRKKCQNLKIYNRYVAANLPFTQSRSSDSRYTNNSASEISIPTTSASFSPDTNTKEPENDEFNVLSQDNTSSNINDDIPLSANKITGRRIIQFEHFMQSLKNISSHGDQFGCTFNNLEITKEIKQGLNSIIELKCNMCNMIFRISTNEQKNESMDTIDINTAAVEGIMSIGSGFYNMEEFLSAIEIPCMNNKTYAKYHTIVSDGWEKAAYQKMIEAGKKEAKFAIENGNVDANGVPCITVVADGCWSKRSYRTNYNASSGAAAIIGHQFGEVLYIGIKNKYCFICLHAKENNTTAKPHKCYKNFDGSSTSMESCILVDGFQNSINVHGIKYTKLIADGDSSTYKKILDSKPYPDTTVEKIECRNHILRNYCNKLKNITSDTRFPLHLRKILNGRILRLRRAVTSAINYRKSSDLPVSNKIQHLKNDIENSIRHVLDDHSKCDTYYCQKKTIAEENKFLELKKCPELYSRIMIVVQSVSRHARSLIFNVDSNIVEQFHSVIAKFVGGKRINFAKGRSYQSRCHAAVVSFNSKNRSHYTLHKTLIGKSPSKIKSKFELNRSEKTKRCLEFRKNNKKSKKPENGNSAGADYGIFCQQPDMNDEEFEREKTIFLEGLMTSTEKRSAFEKDTILQASSSYWLEERKKLLTASNFYKVCTRRPTTSCVNLVKNLLYGEQILHVPAINHGKLYESIAREKLEQQLGVNINLCGMFIDEEFPFLGATPDGLIGTDTLIEIKCPYNPLNLKINELINNKKITFWKKDKSQNEALNKNHSWFYQIQGQLRITGRKKCILAVFTTTDEKIKTEIILKDDQFWADSMEKKLINFYKDCMLPELVDPRYNRHMKIRDPDYITDAINKKKNQLK